MASEEPLFDPTLKKKKKKKVVAFTEDPLGVEADPTYEAAAEAAASAPTIHEQTKSNGSLENGKKEEAVAAGPTPDDEMAMFGDLKKKKKKKAIPMDLDVCVQLIRGRKFLMMRLSTRMPLLLLLLLQSLMMRPRLRLLQILTQHPPWTTLTSPI